MTKLRTLSDSWIFFQDESYSLMMCNNNWFLFLRLHNILSERMTKMYNQAVIIANEEAKDRKERKESVAVALKLKPKSKQMILLGLCSILQF